MNLSKVVPYNFQFQPYARITRLSVSAGKQASEVLVKATPTSKPLARKHVAAVKENMIQNGNQTFSSVLCNDRTFNLESYLNLKRNCYCEQIKTLRSHCFEFSL